MGEGAAGKTGSIILVYEKLQRVADSEKDQVKQRDIREIVTINKVNVGIASEGDTREVVKEHLEYFKANGCDIILIAGRCGTRSELYL